MDAKRDDYWREQAELFKVLANPTRLIILDRLRQGPRCVCALAAELGLEKSVASKHLSKLRNLGLIGQRKNGTLVEYRLLAPCVLDMAVCVTQKRDA
ncbi:MAG: winged helix-turn-helix transcriptional regulator [Spirochaetales bacterium]|nr:winged helix-turn-helix transcriptional regulator [Spirochaetales bacterium]MBP7264227.1 winged helix-turn-helix transcriptional regulator [Spirochaetia bacterium]